MGTCLGVLVKTARRRVRVGDAPLESSCDAPLEQLRGVHLHGLEARPHGGDLGGAALLPSQFNQIKSD